MNEVRRLPDDDAVSAAAALVMPESGRLVWLVDKDAAADLRAAA
jgi:hypothetical protein